MADSAPAATSTARAIRLIPLSAPHGVGFTTLVFISMSAIPLKSANSSLTFLSQRLWNTQIKKWLFSPAGCNRRLGHSWLAAVSLLRPPIAYDASETAASDAQADDLPPDRKDWYEERAAIIEYDGGATRELAERMALQQANKRVKK